MLLNSSSIDRTLASLLPNWGSGIPPPGPELWHPFGQIGALESLLHSQNPGIPSAKLGLWFACTSTVCLHSTSLPAIPPSEPEPWHSSCQIGALVCLHQYLAVIILSFHPLMRAGLPASVPGSIDSILSFSHDSRVACTNTCQYLFYPLILS